MTIYTENKHLLWVALPLWSCHWSRSHSSQQWHPLHHPRCGRWWSRSLLTCHTCWSTGCRSLDGSHRSIRPALHCSGSTGCCLRTQALGCLHPLRPTRSCSCDLLVRAQCDHQALLDWAHVQRAPLNPCYRMKLAYYVVIMNNKRTIHKDEGNEHVSYDNNAVRTSKQASKR